MSSGTIKFQERRDSDELQIMTVRQAIQYRCDTYEQGKTLSVDLEAQLKELKEQIKELDEEAKEIYEEYYPEVGK